MKRKVYPLLVCLKLMGFYLATLCVMPTSPIQGQGIADLIEFFTIHPNKKAVARNPLIYPSKIILAPILTYAPETDIGLGLGIKHLFKMRGSGPETRTSNMPISILYTLENQFVINSGYEIFFNQERWMLSGNFILKSFPQLYYGIGADTPASNEEQYEYGQILVETRLLKQTSVRYLFAGLGIRYNHFSNIEAASNGILEDSNIPGVNGSTSAGMEMVVVYDSRDNLLNAQQGVYAELSHGFYGKVMGGTHRFQLTRLDLRYFLQPFRNRKDVLAFQLKSHFSYDGTPFRELAQFGGGEIMRGYYEGRYVENHMIAMQAEYRMQFSKRWGGVVFAGIGKVSNELRTMNLQHLRPSVGIGARFMIDTRENLNLRLDWGFGNNTKNYYFDLAEAF